MMNGELPVIPLPDNRLDELFRLQRRLAEVENPVYAAFGEDEFVVVDGFRALVYSGDTLIVMNDDVINSFVCIAPSVYMKYYNAAIADLFIGVDSAQAEAGMFRKWIDVATAHARKLGYVTVLVQTFFTNVEIFGDLREAGFEFCAELPSAGRIRGVGLTDSVLWRKYIADRSTCDFSMRRVPREFCWYFGPPRPRRYIGLPKKCTLKDGTVIEWNNLQPEDIDSYCRLFVDASALGKGYTTDISNQGMMRHYIESDTVVCSSFKTIKTDEVVCAVLLRPTTYNRTTTPIVSGGAMVVRPDFASKGLGSVLMGQVWPELSISCGYDAVCVETHDKHKAMLHMAVKNGMRMIGCVPGTYKFPTSGWGDTLLVYKPIERYLNQTRLLYRLCAYARL